METAVCGLLYRADWIPTPKTADKKIATYHSKLLLLRMSWKVTPSVCVCVCVSVSKVSSGVNSGR